MNKPSAFIASCAQEEGNRNIITITFYKLKCQAVVSKLHENNGISFTDSYNFRIEYTNEI